MANARKVARQIVDAIAADIQDRKGIGNEFEAIDKDVLQEMLIHWIDIAEADIKTYDSR
jgi:hypothetical protein